MEFKVATISTLLHWTSLCLEPPPPQVSDLEALRDLNEELEEQAIATERELREVVHNCLIDNESNFTFCYRFVKQHRFELKRKNKKEKNNKKKKNKKDWFGMADILPLSGARLCA